MSIIYVDGKKYKVNQFSNLLQACLSVGLDIPYFCWHPALGSFGGCRQCAVKQYKDSKCLNGNIVMSCMTSVLDGAYFSIKDEEVFNFRKSILELMMINHPHDCPVCEEGGNCHLQDMTVMTTHILRRYRFTKRTHQNQYLGPFISHEMNRCINCYRCVRYYKDYADGKDFGVYGIHDNLYFGRPKNGVLKNEFSGNLIEICPTGVFTEKAHSGHYNRKWDIQFAPSICQHCSVGCNISAGERDGQLTRVENRYNSAINGYFLCDRGRFGYGYLNRKDRPRNPKQLSNSNWLRLSPENAIYVVSKILKKSKKIIGVGSARASIESNFILQQLVGEKNFCAGMSSTENVCVKLIVKLLSESGIYTPSLREIETCDAILILGEDLTKVAARIALSVRQAIKNKSKKIASEKSIQSWQFSAVINASQGALYPLCITSVDQTGLDDISVLTYRAPVENQARLGFAIAHALDKNAPIVSNFDTNLNKKLKIIVDILTKSKKPLIISGSHSGSKAIIESAANIAKALKGRGSDVGIILVVSQVNSIGLALLNGKPIEYALSQFDTGEVDTLIILENDLYRYIPKNKIESSLRKVKNVIVFDHQNTKTSEKANFIFSSASFAESDGTCINYEGRAQRFFQVYDPNYSDKNSFILESWRWLYALKNFNKNKKLDWGQLDRVIDDFVASFPKFKAIKDAAPEASFRIRGQKLSRIPHRESGRTAINADITVHEPRQPQDFDTMFTFSMEGNNQPNAVRSEIPFVWAPGWNSQQAWNKFQIEVGGELRYGNPGSFLFDKKNLKLNWFNNIPVEFTESKKWRIVPYYDLFYCEEMVQRSPILQKKNSISVLKMNFNDALKLGLKNGAIIEFDYLGEYFRFSIHLSDTLHRGQLGLLLGSNNLPLFLIGMQIKNLREAL